MKEQLQKLLDNLRQLQAQKDSGAISDEEFRQQIQAASVVDINNPNCWWNIHPDTGRWIYFDGREWVDKTPEDFSPVAFTPARAAASPAEPPPESRVSSTPPPRRALARKGGGRAWVWALVAIVIIAGAAVVAWYLIQSGIFSGEYTDEKAKGDIEDALEKFFEALEDNDIDRLKEVIAGEIKEKVEGAEDDDALDGIWRQYRADDVDIYDDEIDVDGDEAEATVIVEAGGLRYEQELELEQDGGEWKVVSVGERMELREDEEEPRSGGYGASADEWEVRDAVDEFFSAVRGFDLERIKVLTTGEAREQFIALLETEDPDMLNAARERFSRFDWEILFVEFSNDPDSAMVFASTELENVSPYSDVTLRRVGNKWLVESIASRYVDPREEPYEEPAIEEEPEEGGDDEGDDG